MNALKIETTVLRFAQTLMVATPAPVKQAMT